MRDRECVICHSKNNLTNGHYIRRGVFATRWNLINCNCQCVTCNSIHETNILPYQNFMKNRYGLKALTDLNDTILNHVRYTRQDLIGIYMELIQEGASLFGVGYG